MAQSKGVSAKEPGADQADFEGILRALAERLGVEAPGDIPGAVDRLALCLREAEERLDREHSIRRTATKAWSDQLNLFQSVFQLTPDWMGVKDPSLVYVAANRAFCDFVGRKEYRVLGSRSLDLFPAAEAETLTSADKQVLRTGKGVALDARLTGVSGTRWVQVLKEPILDKKGRVEGILFTVRDIHDRKMAELALARSEEVCRCAYEQAAVGMMACGPDGRILRANMRLADMAGMSSEELVGRNMHELGAEDCGRKVKRALAEILDGRVENCRVEFCLLRPDKGQVWVSAVMSPVRNEQGRVAQVTVVLQDVTDRENAMRALKRSENLTANILSSSQDCIAVTDLEGAILYLNAGGRHMAGLEDQEAALGTKCESYWRDTDLHEAHKAMETAKQGGMGRFTGYCPTPEGAPAWWDVVVSPILDEGGRVDRLLVMARDATERRQTLDALRKAKDDAEAASIAKTEFVANMSHEVRTPLNAVMGMLQLLEESALEPAQADFVKTAHNSAESLLALFNDLLDFSRLETGSLGLERNLFDPAAVLDNIEAVFASHAGDKGISLAIEADPDLPGRVVGDERRLRQVLFCLVGNAVKFTSRGGVKVRARRGPDKGAMFSLEFEVEDTGCGIPEESLELVFEAFYQVDGSATRKYQGTGLGLGIVKRLVELMGGDIRVDSEIDGGTTVGFNVLAAQDKPEARPERRALDVLVVEDDSLLRTVAARLLTKGGHRPREAASGAEALEVLKGEDFDAVLMDVIMPDMDGVETTKRIREGGLGRKQGRLPVIALTAKVQPGDREWLLQSGFDAYLAKPLHMDDLMETLDQVADPGA